jgi:AcrR family transcriptional regulator
MDRIDTPQNERSRRTRAAILDATLRLLEEEGAQATTMASVARLAGVTRHAVYLHFSSRAELLLALHAHVDDKLDLQASLRPLYEAPDAVTRLDAFTAHLARFHPKIRAVDLALLRAKDTDPDVSELIEQGLRVWHDACLEVARGLAEEGRLAEPWTTRTAADLMWSLMFPETLDRLMSSRGWSSQQYGELLAVLLRRTLVQPSGESPTPPKAGPSPR